MSRIGKQPIEIPDGVDRRGEAGRGHGQGPEGRADPDRHTGHEGRAVDDGAVTVERPTDRGEHRALHGLTRSLIANMVEGVTDGFEKRLEIQGVGYRAQLKGKALELALGYSHPVTMQAPDGIEFEVPAADRGRRPGHRQAAGRRDRRADPQAAARPSPTRARASATPASTSPARSGRGRDRDDGPHQAAEEAAPPPPRARARSAAARSARACRSSARTAASSPS